jgi:transcription elongation factor SPT5
MEESECTMYMTWYSLSKLDDGPLPFLSQTLIPFSAVTVGCVIRVDHESLRIIDQNGSVKNVLPSRISTKVRPQRDAVATDRNGAEIRRGDTVREIYGEQRSGVILHIHRSFLFLHNKAQVENTGIVVARTTNVVAVSAKGGRAVGPDLSKMNPALMRNLPNRPEMPPPRAAGRDRLLGKTVTIRKGTHKGLIGIVREASDDTVRVELHSKGTRITVTRDMVVVKE